MRKLISIVGYIGAASVVASAKMVTLVANEATESTRVTIGTNEVLEVVSFPSNSSGNCQMRIIRNDRVIFTRLASNPGSFQDTKIVAGPAHLDLIWTGGDGGYCTVNITPD